jgi:hypothetical protein
MRIMNRYAALSGEQMRDLRQCEEYLGLILVAYSEFDSSGRYSSLSKCELDKIHKLEKEFGATLVAFE